MLTLVIRKTGVISFTCVLTDLFSNIIMTNHITPECDQQKYFFLISATHVDVTLDLQASPSSSRQNCHKLKKQTNTAKNSFSLLI